MVINWDIQQYTSFEKKQAAANVKEDFTVRKKRHYGWSSFILNDFYRRGIEKLGKPVS